MTTTTAPTPKIDFSKLEISVSGTKVTVDSSELTIVEISEAMDTVAARMAYWGSVYAEAEAELERADHSYRNWRANHAKLVAQRSDKPPEWKVTAEIEAEPLFLKFKEGIARGTRNVTLLKAIYEAFKVKASLLQSKGAILRAELEATGMHTKTTPNPRRVPVRTEEEGNDHPGVAAMKDINNRKKNPAG